MNDSPSSTTRSRVPFTALTRHIRDRKGSPPSISQLRNDHYSGRFPAELIGNRLWVAEDDLDRIAALYGGSASSAQTASAA